MSTAFLDRTPSTALSATRLALALAFLGLLVAPAGAHSSEPTVGLFRATTSAVKALDAQGSDVALLQSRAVEVDLSLLENHARVSREIPSASRPLQLQFFAGVEADVVFEAPAERDALGFQAYRGHIVRAAGLERPKTGAVVLVEKDGILSGTFDLGETFISLRPAREPATVGRSVDGDAVVHVLESIDRSVFEPEAEPEIWRPLGPLAAPEDVATTDKAIGGGSSEVSVVILYTTAARVGAGGTHAIESQAALAAHQLKFALVNSAQQATVHFAGTYEVPYAETGDRVQDLAWLREHMTNLKGAWGADVVSLIVETMHGACGRGAIMHQNSTAFAPMAANVVKRRCATHNYSYAHEVGHNMGGAHDRGHSSSPGLFSYSFAYQDPSEAFRTLLSYNCANGCPRILYYSSPNVSYQGRPTGVAPGSPQSADNAGTFAQSLPTVAQFSDHLPRNTFTNYDVNTPPDVELGYDLTRTFLADVDADGRADYCRYTGDPADNFFSCALARGSEFISSYHEAFYLDPGYGDWPRLMADVTADGRADYCRFVGNFPAVFFSCAVTQPHGGWQSYGVNSPPINQGFSPGHAFLPRFLVDVNADGRADYCRFVGARPELSCALATASGTFGTNDVVSSGLDVGYDHMPRLMADVNGDRRADYCRVVGDWPNRFLSCAVATASGTFGQYDVNSLPESQGFEFGDRAQLADVDGDGRADYCRVAGAWQGPNVFFSCALANDDHTFGLYDINSGQGTPFRFDIGWPDFFAMAPVDGTGRAAYCRYVGDSPNRFLSCGNPQLTPPS
ncbi:MAG: reprolysin-like metallopeptidase [Acidobacteriota bacterium]